MLWIERVFFSFSSALHFVVLILFVFMGRPIRAFERASMDWILQGLISRGDSEALVYTCRISIEDCCMSCANACVHVLFKRCVCP